MLLQPKIMAKATPAMPRKGANLGVRSASDIVAAVATAVEMLVTRWRREGLMVWGQQ